MPFPYLAVILFAASTILGELMRPKPQQAKKPTLDEFSINTAERNRPIAVLWGRQEIKGGNVIWYGDYDNTAIVKKIANLMTFGLTSIKQTLGYRHYIGFALAFCYGTVDKVYRIKFGDKTAWANESGQAPTGTQLVSKPAMYGGDDGASGGRGGVYSIVEFYPGTRIQSASAYLRSLNPLHSAYRGLCYMVWRGPSGGGSIASANKTGNIKTGYVGNQNVLDSVTVEAERCPKVLSGVNPWYRIGDGDANPAECLYELLTNAEWGLGRTTGYDTANWQSVAQTLYNEGLGMSAVWDTQKSVKAMAQEILDTIGGIIVTDNATGNWRIKLARADYNPATITVLEAAKPGEAVTGHSCVVDISDYSCGAYDETTSGVKATFNERRSDKNYQPGTAFAYDRANVAIQGQPIIAQINYPIITTYTNALKLAWRDLVARCIPLKKCTITTDRNGARLAPGDVFKLKWPDYRVDGVVFRVLTVNRGKLNSGTVELRVVQDAFSLGATVFTPPPSSSWVDPISNPTAVATAKVVEVPRHAAGDFRNLWVAALKPSGNTNYDLHYSEDTGTTYQPGLQSAEFTPVGTLVNAIGRGSNAVDTSGAIIVAPLSGMAALESFTAADIAAGSNIALIEGQDELIAFEGFTVNGSGQYILSNVYRGILDTVPAAHLVGARVWFLHYGVGITGKASGLVSTPAIRTKLLSRSPRGELALADAPHISTTLVDRYLKPYPPGNMAVVDSSSVSGTPAVMSGQARVTWAHRNRLTQANVIAQNTTGIATEAGVTYTLKIYGQNGTLLRTVTDLTTELYDYTPTLELSDTGLAVLQTSLRFELNSVRSGVDSLQTQKITITR